MDSTTDNFLPISDEMNPKIVNYELLQITRQYSSLLQRYYQYQLHLLFYRLIRHAKITASDLATESGYSRQHLIKIVDDFDKKLQQKNEKL